MSAYYIYVCKCTLFCRVEHSGSESTRVKKFSIQREKGSTSSVNQSPAVGWRRNTCTWLITSSVDIDHLQLVSVQICISVFINVCINTNEVLYVHLELHNCSKLLSGTQYCLSILVENWYQKILKNGYQTWLVCTCYFSIFWIEAWQSASSRMAELLTKEEKDKLVEQRMEQMKKKNEAIRWDLLSVCQNLTGCLVDFTTIRFILIGHIPETYFLWCILSTLGLAGCVTILFRLKW